MSVSAFCIWQSQAQLAINTARLKTFERIGTPVYSCCFMPIEISAIQRLILLKYSHTEFSKARASKRLQAQKY
jgi:hypothetical protein